MKKKSFLLPVATTLSALLGASVPSMASVPTDKGPSAGIASQWDSGIAENTLTLQHAARSIADLSPGKQWAYHVSHVSHSSHVSHQSHSSHYSGY